MIKPVNKKKRFKRALYILSLLLLLLILLLSGLWVALNNVEARVQKVLSASLKGDVKTKDISFSYPFKLTVSKFSADLDNGVFFSSEKLYADLNIFALLSRKIKISEISIDSPVIKLSRIPKEPNKVQQVINNPYAEDKTVKPLPFSFDLSEVKISSLSFTLPIGEQEDRIEFKGISLYLKNSSVDRKSHNLSDGVKCELLIISDSAAVKYFVKDYSYNFNITSRTGIKWAERRAWKIDSKIRVDSKEDVPEIKTDLKAAGCALDTISLDKFSISVNSKRIFSITGKIEQPARDGKIMCDLTGDTVNLSSINRIIEPFLKKNSISINGFLLPLKAHIKGSVKRPEGFAAISAENLHLNVDSFDVKNERMYFYVNLAMQPNSKLGNVTTTFVTGKAGIFKADSSIVEIYKSSVRIKSNIENRTIVGTSKFAGRVDSVFGGIVNFSGSFKKAQNKKSLSALFKLSADSLEISRFLNVENRTEGLVFCRIEAEMKDIDNVNVSAEVSGENIGFLNERDSLYLPHISAGVDFAARKTIRSIWTLTQGILTGGDAVYIPFSGEIDSEKGALNLSVKQGKIKSKQLVDLWNSAKGVTHIPVNVTGEPEFNLKISAVHGSTPYYRMFGSFILPDINLFLPDDSLYFSGIKSSIKFSVLNDSASIKGFFTLDSLKAPQIRPEPFCMSQINFKGFKSREGRVNIDTVNIQFDRGVINCGIAGCMDSGSVALGGAFFYRSDSFKNGISQFLSRGDASLKFSFNMSGDSISVKGTSFADSVFLKAGQRFNLENLCMRVPFNFNISPKGSFLLKKEPVLQIISNEQAYAVRREVYQNIFPEIGVIHADKIAVSNVIIEKPEIDVIISDGTITIPFFGALIMGGSVGGAVRVEADNFKEKGIRYFFNGQFSGIDASYIAGISGGEKTVINATALINGKGIDPEKGIDINGYFNISDMGSEFASVLLGGIDPSGTDKSIQITKRLIKTGWKPLLFSFDLRHGYIYPSLSLSQPWFSPIRIPEKLEYGRLPMAFFMENMKRNKGKINYEKN